MKPAFRIIKSIDWVLMAAVGIVIFFGLITMKSFGVNDTTTTYFFTRQLIWLAVGFFVFMATLFIDWSFLRTNSIFLILGYFAGVLFLVWLLVGNRSIRGAESWITLGPLTFEPAELMKPILLLLLAKYFSRRHVEIARIQTLLISGFYVFIPVFLVFIQPDFGSAAVLGFLWLGMALVGGIRIRHLGLLALIGFVGAFVLWQMVLLPYQKTRILAFVNPQSDIRGSGYHAFQSMVAVGSGEIVGRGIGFGTQSRLSFLPEHETDFIFAAFAEEWGFIGVLLLFLFFGIMLWRILWSGMYAENNFERLYAAGLALVIFFQTSIHIGMNIGVFPITGLGMPFVSYGGSGLVTMFLSIGILESMLVHKKGIFLSSSDRYKEGIVGA